MKYVYFWRTRMFNNVYLRYRFLNLNNISSDSADILPEKITNRDV